MLTKGRTAIDGLSGSGLGVAPGVADTGSAAVTSATNRNPRLGSVLITACVLPSSPTALRAELMQVFRAPSEMMRRCHTNSIRSSFETTRCRFSIRQAISRKTCGSSATGRPASQQFQALRIEREVAELIIHCATTSTRMINSKAFLSFS